MRHRGGAAGGACRPGGEWWWAAVYTLEKRFGGELAGGGPGVAGLKLKGLGAS